MVVEGIDDGGHGGDEAADEWKEEGERRRR